MLLNFILPTMRDELDKATTLENKNWHCIAYTGVEICVVWYK